jgi:hypothetical protein
MMVAAKYREEPMKTFLWITIVGSVLALLAAGGARPPLASPSLAAQAECDCSNLKVLQIELRNAIQLQQNFRNKIADLRGMNQPTSQNALQVFAKQDALRGHIKVPGYNGPDHVDYYPFGRDLHADTDLSRYTSAQLCRMADSAAKVLDEAKQKSACAGIATATQAHEDFHISYCQRIGYANYEAMHGADRAQEEVEAYGVEIAVLRAEIAKVLEHANARVEIEANTRLDMPPNPLYNAIIITNDANVPMSRAAVSGEMIKLDGEAKQTTDGKIEGNCKFTGLPSTLTARASIETDGLVARVHYSVEGTQSSVGMQCTIGNRTGSGMSMPVPIKGGNVPDFEMPLEDRAEKEFDQGTGESAQVMARGGAKMSGKGKIRLIFCEESK